MKVFIIVAERLGSIGVATSPKSAMRWLLEEGWINEYTGFYPCDEDAYELENITVCNYCDREGIANWQQWLIDNATAKWISDHFLFYLRQVNLAETE
jgi:hypothetical protein